MASRHSFSSFLLTGQLIAAFAAGCGGAGPTDDVSIETEQTFRGEDVGCGTNCPETCWVEIHTVTGGKETRLWIFNADHHIEQALRDGKYSLTTTNPVQAFDRFLDVPPQVPPTLFNKWMLPSSFDTDAQGLTGKVLLAPTEPDMTCELGTH